MPNVALPIVGLAARTKLTCRHATMPGPAHHHDDAPLGAAAAGMHARLALVAVGLTGALCGLVAWLWIAFGGWQAHADLSLVAPRLREVVLALALGGPLALIAVVIAYLRSASASEHESHQRALQQRRRSLQLLDLLPVPVALCGVKQSRSQINRPMAELFEVERGDALDLPWDWQGFVVAEDWAAWTGAIETARRTGRPQWLRARMRAGEVEHAVLAQIAPIGDARADDAALAVMLHLAQDTAAQQSTLQLRELLEMAEAEKWLFGQAVHDELGQRLSGIAYFAKALQRKLEAEQRPEAADAGWLTNLANESMSVARGLARGLVPVGSDDAGALAALLAELCQNTSKMFTVHCTLDADAGFDPGDAARANHLYRAVQELITNAIKHGGARNVQVRLEVHAQGQRVSVRNDGVGLASGALPRRSGMGLNGVRSRVAHLGGQFTLADMAGGGVLARIELPTQSGAAVVPMTLDAPAKVATGEKPAAADNREGV